MLRRVLVILTIGLLLLSLALAQDQPGQNRFPTALNSAASLIETADNARTVLKASLPANATSMTVTSTAAFPATGLLVIDGRSIVSYTGKTATTFTGLVWGLYGTPALTFAAGVTVEMRVLAAEHNTLSTAIRAGELKIGTGASQPSLGKFLRGIGAGQSAWGALTLDDVTAVLGSTPAPISNPVFTGAVSVSGTDPFLQVGPTAAWRIQYLTSDGSLRISKQTVGEAASIDANLNFIHGTAALATNASNGFVYLPDMAGPPTGTPANYAGRVPLTVDTANSRLMGYFGGSWVNLSGTGGGGGGTVLTVATGNGLQGGPILTSGTINLNLNSGGGLSKTLGAGSNELGIPAGGVTNAMLAGSIADTKLATIASAGKVLDTALSSNVPLKNAANVFTASNEMRRVGIGATFADALTLTNPTAAIVGAQIQQSPSLYNSSAVWNGSASEIVESRQTLIPLWNSTKSRSEGRLTWAFQTAGGGYEDAGYLDSKGHLVATAGFGVGTVPASTWNGISVVGSGLAITIDEASAHVLTLDASGIRFSTVTQSGRIWSLDANTLSLDLSGGTLYMRSSTGAVVELVNSTATSADLFTFHGPTLTSGTLLKGKVPASGFTGDLINITDDAGSPVTKFRVTSGGVIITGSGPTTLTGATGTILDSALSANVPLKNAANVFSTVQTIGNQSNLIDSLSIGANTPQQFAVTHGSSGSSTGSTATTISIQRFDASNGGASATVATQYVGVRKTAGTTYMTTAILGLAESTSSGAVHDVVGLSGFAGSGLNGAPTSTGKAFGVYADATLWNATAQANGAEFDVRNHSGATAPIVTSSMPTGATVGLAIVGNKFGSGSDKYSVGLIFQNGATPARTGIHFDTTAIDSAGYAIEFNYLTQGTPIRFRNNTSIVWRGSAGTLDLAGLKLNASDQWELGAGLPIRLASDGTFSFPTPGTAVQTLHLVPTTGTDGNSVSITFGGNNGGTVVATAVGGIYAQSSSAYGLKLRFGTSDSFGTGSKIRLTIDHKGSIGINGESFGSGEAVIFIANATTLPSTNPTGGGVLYCDGGALKFRSSNGTVTTVAPL
jgi:hypothetical protein